MQISSTSLPGVLIVEPAVFGDDRGFFFESWNQEKFAEAVDPEVVFVQDNHSRSTRGVLRGLHYQNPNPQGKLVRCSLGAVWDVAVDIREGSATFGEWFGLELTEDNKKQLWVPPRFAHGFVTLSDRADIQYKTTDYYNPDGDRCLRFDDPALAIAWPLEDVRLSQKDKAAPFLSDVAILG